MIKGRTLLVVDDDRAVRSALRVNLTRVGVEVKLAVDADEALALLHQEAVDLVLTDVRMPGRDGLALTHLVRRTWPNLPVVVMTGQASIQDAVQAMRQGASDYVTKPLAFEELLLHLERALSHQALSRELDQLRREVKARFGFERLVGDSPPLLAAIRRARAVAPTVSTVLLTGPTGTGKELFAAAIHHASARSRGPFVRVNCAALPPHLLETELFGHERGAFTGAIRQHQGRFEQADGGTLLLDEIGELELPLQAKLLRVLESGEIQRVGGSAALRVDTRVIASTNRDLRAEVQAGRFRADLFYRLNVVEIRLPGLAERSSDLPLLIEHFLKEKAAQHQRPMVTLTAAQVKALSARSWPGNVRELEHFIERLVVLGAFEAEEELEAPRSPSPPPTPAASTTTGGALRPALEALERQLILEALQRHKGNRRAAAAELKLSKSNLHYRLQRLGLEEEPLPYRGPTSEGA